MKPRIEYPNLPAYLLKRSQAYRRPPYGMCACNQPGELHAGGYYTCKSCQKKSDIHSPSEYYGTAGSNLHRKTGKPVDTHILATHKLNLKGTV
jgi:hypothetical protein